MFDPSKHSHFAEQTGDGGQHQDGSFTFRVKMTSGKELHLQDIVLFIGLDGIAICDPTHSGESGEGAVLNAGQASETAQVRFLLKNLHFPLKNLHFLIMNLHFYIKSGAQGPDVLPVRAGALVGEPR